MKTITNKEYTHFQKYKDDLLYGRILTPDGLRIICAGYDYDPEEIGRHFLQMLLRFTQCGEL